MLISCTFLTSEFLIKVTWLHNFPLQIQRQKPSSTNFTDLLIQRASHIILIFFSRLFNGRVKGLQEPYILPYKSVFSLYFSHKLTFGWYEFGQKYKNDEKGTEQQQPKFHPSTRLTKG
jgi:hypothetical protein